MALRSDSRGRVLVTGLSSFTGRYLSPLLISSGYGLCDSDSDGLPHYDLKDKSSLLRLLKREQPDFVLHLAAQSFIAQDDAIAFYAVNTVGTINLLEALHESELAVAKIVVASSANIYGNATAEPILESTPPCPVNDYACSKLAMEFMARTWMDRLPIVITRPFNYTGPGQAEFFLVPKLVDHFARRLPRIELGNLDVVRDFSDVRSTADAYVRLLSKGISGETYNICSGEGRSLQSILATLMHISGHSLEVDVNPTFVRDSDVKRLVGSNAKLTATLGGSMPCDFAETLRWMYEKRLREL